MRILTALKAFFKALKTPSEAQAFLEGKKEENRSSGDYSHLRLLSLLQKEGRLIDFLKEDIAQFNDAQIGAAVRQIHQQCGKSLEEFVAIRPLVQETEGSKMTIPQGYDPASFKIVGHVQGSPPYQGILRHKGWMAHKLALPKQQGEKDQKVISPAEVEVQA